MKQAILFFSTIFLAVALNAQNIGIGTTSPNASAQLDITSTTRGLLIPRMTGSQRVAIGTPVPGLIVYQTNADISNPSASGFYLYESSGWRRIARADEISGGSTTWTVSGTDQYSNLAGNVGIGTGAPTKKFHLVGDFQQDNGSITLNTAAAIIQFQNAAVNKSFIQQSGNNLRMGTSSGNDLGKMIIRMDGSDKVFIDSTGNMQIIGEQEASMTEHGYLMLGSTSGRNIIMDNNEIIARDAGALNSLILQTYGGNVGIGVAAPDEKLTMTNNIKLNGAAGVVKFETAVAGSGNPSSSRYAPGLLFLREGSTTQLGKIEYVDTLNYTNFMRIRMGSNIENGITLNTNNYTGLGTANPLGRLHIKGENGIDEIAINAGTSTSGETAAIQFYNTSFTGGAAADKKGFLMLDDNDLKIGINSGNTTGKFIIRTNATDHVFVDQNGNMGIGTSTPANKLHIAGGLTVVKSGEAIKIDGNNSSINFYQSGSFKSFISHSASGLYMGVNNGNIQLDVSNGHVAIGSVVLTGTDKDAYKLAVNGNVVCTELKVKLAGAWPDYVFGKNYQLPSLRQLDMFIRENNHLPNIPAAAEIEKNGVQVGDMQKRMMEKIEELTLYVIELQKQVDELKNQNK